MWNAHVAAKATEPPLPLFQVLAESRWPAFSHHMRDVVTAPNFFELALATYSAAQEYFGELPLLYSVNAFWTQPASGQLPYVDTHYWHRDGDDRKQLVMFMFGTDGGVHRYQRGSHCLTDAELGYDPAEPPPERVATVTGKAGTVFFADTSGLHVGDRALAPRLLLWARWGVSDPPESYRWDRLEAVPRDLLGDRYPADEALQRAIRLVVV